MNKKDKKDSRYWPLEKLALTSELVSAQHPSWTISCSLSKSSEGINELAVWTD